MAVAMKHQKRKQRGGFPGSMVKLFLLVVFLVLGFFLIIKVGPQLLSSKAGSSSRFNFVLSSQTETAFVSLDAESGKATVVNIPRDLLILSVAHGYGQYPIGKVFEVGQLDSRGGEVLSDTVSLFLGVGVDGFVRLAGFSPERLREAIVNPDFVLTSKSNLSAWERFQLAREMFNLRFDKIKVFELSGKTEDLLLPDGSSAKFYLPEDLDRLLLGSFAEEKIVKEGARVAVVNTTEVAGLGSAFTRVISSLGATVVDVTTDEKNFKECKIETSKILANSETVRRIADVLNCEVSVDLGQGRADVTVFLGARQAGIFGR